MTTISTIDAVNYYRSAGFKVFPLGFESKIPLPTHIAGSTDEPFSSRNNIGIYAGCPDSFVILDADNSTSKIRIHYWLAGLGLDKHVTVVKTPKRSGAHYWLKVLNVPDHIQCYYKLPESVGGGEARFREPAYVAAPFSKVKEGVYDFTQGGLKYYIREQPFIDFKDMIPVLPIHAIYPGSKTVANIENDLSSEFVAEPPILKLVDLIKDAVGDVPKVDFTTGKVKPFYFRSRSEAEASLVTGLVAAGWSFTQVLTLFEENNMPHFEANPRKEKYLERTYLSSKQYVSKYLASKSATKF